MFRSLTRYEALHLMIGDEIRPNPLWNNSERPPRHLPPLCEIEAIDRTKMSQTGTMVTVRNVSGHPQTLDAGWFGRLEVDKG